MGIFNKICQEVKIEFLCHSGLEFMFASVTGPVNQSVSIDQVMFFSALDSKNDLIFKQIDYSFLLISFSLCLGFDSFNLWGFFDEDKGFEGFLDDDAGFSNVGCDFGVDNLYLGSDKIASQKFQRCALFVFSL